MTVPDNNDAALVREALDDYWPAQLGERIALNRRKEVDAALDRLAATAERADQARDEAFAQGYDAGIRYAEVNLGARPFASPLSEAPPPGETSVAEARRADDIPEAIDRPDGHHRRCPECGEFCSPLRAEATELRAALLAAQQERDELREQARRDYRRINRAEATVTQLREKASAAIEEQTGWAALPDDVDAEFEAEMRRTHGEATYALLELLQVGTEGGTARQGTAGRSSEAGSAEDGALSQSEVGADAALAQDAEQETG